MYLFQKNQSITHVSFIKLRQIVCKLFKLSTNFLTVPRTSLFQNGDIFDEIEIPVLDMEINVFIQKYTYLQF